MKDSETLYVYLSRMFDIINQMKSYGEELSRERIVQKLLISLPKTYDAICSVIEHSRDLETLEVQEVVASLKGFEQRLDLHAESSTERAFASLNVATKGARSGGFSGNLGIRDLKRTGSQGGEVGIISLTLFRSKTMLREIGITDPIMLRDRITSQRNWDHRPHYTTKQNNSQGDCKWCDRLHYGKCWYEGKPKCTGCGKPGHSVKDCHENKGMQKVNYARQMGET